MWSLAQSQKANQIVCNKIVNNVKRMGRTGLYHFPLPFCPSIINFERYISQVQSNIRGFPKLCNLIRLIEL